MKPRVLTVEDEPDFAELLEYKLRRMDLEVIRAASGLQALHAARQWMPDVILLDLMLPDLDGVCVLEILRSQASTKEIPVIALTALDEKFLRHKTRSKVEYHFQKPVDMDVLGACVWKLVELRQLAIRVFARPGDENGGGCEFDQR